MNAASDSLVQGCSEQTALVRQDLSCTYLSHHELESAKYNSMIITTRLVIRITSPLPMAPYCLCASTGAMVAWLSACQSAWTSAVSPSLVQSQSYLLMMAATDAPTPQTPQASTA